MMKHLILIPLFFSLISCMPPEIKEIVDRTTSCPNGICSQSDSKPANCNGAPQFNALVGTFKSELVTDPKTFVTQRAQYSFNSGEATYVQFCEKPATKEFESPFVKSSFTVNSDVTKLRFNQPDSQVAKSKTFECKAELTDEILAIKAEGNCLMLQSKIGKQYFVRQ